MSDKEFLDELLARKELIRLGYTREKCPECGDKEILCGYATPLCVMCGDKRYVWKEPPPAGTMTVNI